jgi:hypothetical protein
MRYYEYHGRLREGVNSLIFIYHYFSEKNYTLISPPPSAEGSSPLKWRGSWSPKYYLFPHFYLSLLFGKKKKLHFNPSPQVQKDPLPFPLHFKGNGEDLVPPNIIYLAHI